MDPMIGNFFVRWITYLGGAVEVSNTPTHWRKMHRLSRIMWWYFTWAFYPLKLFLKHFKAYEMVAYTWYKLIVFSYEAYR